MRYQPSLQTDRLRLRPFIADDAATVAELAGTGAMAEATISIPHPFSLTAAKTWITSLPHLFRSGLAVHFAVCTTESNELIGCFALKNLDKTHQHAELECWIGAPWQRQGYATEAAKAVLAFGFEQLNLNRIYGYYLISEPNAATLLEKLGLQQEGIMRQAVHKKSGYKDLGIFAILADEYKKAG